MLRRFLIKQIRLRERLWQDSVKGVSLMTYWLDSREFLRMMNPVRRGRVALGRRPDCVCPFAAGRVRGEVCRQFDRGSPVPGGHALLMSLLASAFSTDKLAQSR